MGVIRVIESPTSILSVGSSSMVPWLLEWKRVEALAVIAPADRKVFSSSPGKDLHPIPAFIRMNHSLPRLSADSPPYTSPSSQG